MKPEALTQAVEEIMAQVRQGQRPADRVISAYTRARRYIGSHDRRHIVETVWEAIRALPCPEWLAEAIGDPELVAALNEKAPADFIAADRGAVIRKHPEFSATPYSPFGLRAAGRIKPELLKKLPIEPQDESSQIAAIMCAAQPNHKIIDYCAGAGGKALALGLLLKGQGRQGKILVHDVSPDRLKDLNHRAARLGLKNITKIIKPTGLYDRFIVDAPCSGTGTARRSPDLRQRLSMGRVAELAKIQSEILDTAAGFVAPGGMLLYFTCSVLRVENEEQIIAFLARHENFRLVPAAKLWAEALPNNPYPHIDPNTLRLGPLTSGTDGFFIAAVERS